MAEKISLDWSSIETVFLDMDGTLLDLHYDNHFWLEHLPTRYAEKHSLNVEEAKEQLKARYSSIQGTLNWYCIDHWSELLDIDVIGLKHETSQRIRVRETVEQFLSYLQQQQKYIILLTNAHPKTVEIKFSHTPIGKYFDRVITSHDLGLAKEESGFWDKLHKHVDFDIQHSLFIDDNLDVLRAAQQHNIEHLFAIHKPDSQQDAMDTEEFVPVECFSQLL